MIFGGSTVMSRTVEGAPPAVGPPSSTRSSPPAKYATTASAVVGGSSPEGFALGAVTGSPSILTRPCATGWIADFWIRRGLAVGVVRKSAMGLGWITAAIGFLGCSSAGPHSYLAWLMLAGVGLGTGNSGIWAFSQTLAGPRVVGRWCGLQNGFGNLAGVIGPALTGFTVDWTGHFQVAIIITATVCLLGALVWVFLVGEVKEVDWRPSLRKRMAIAAAGTA